MNAVSLYNLWSYLQGLSLSASNQRWLGERLIEASKVAKKGKSANVAIHRVHKRRKALSDAELAERLAQYAPLTAAILGKGSITFSTYIREICIGKRCILSQSFCKLCVT